MEFKSENTNDHYPNTVFVKLAKQLSSNLRLKSTKCFEVTDDDKLPELTGFVSEILQCNSVSKVSDVMKTHLPGVEFNTDTSVNTDPVLGDFISEQFHHTLDQDLFNFFYPEEWVGYENDHGIIVYAQIWDEVDQYENMNLQRMMT